MEDRIVLIVALPPFSFLGCQGIFYRVGPRLLLYFRPLQTKPIGVELVSGLGANKPFTFSGMRSFGLLSAMNFLISKKGTAAGSEKQFLLYRFGWVHKIVSKADWIAVEGV